MKSAGVSGLILNREFIIKFDNGGMCAASFSHKTDSTSRIIRRITHALKNRLKQEHKVAALQDIERQLIERHNEIFSRGESTSTEEDESKSHYLDAVTKLRKRRQESNSTYEEWQKSVQEKYKNLRLVVQKNFPGAWPFVEFCLSVKTIMNIKGCTLPFIGVLLDVPSSLKTLVIELFRKYPHSFYTDSFTPNSLLSHNSALTEEQLQKVDMIPKMKNNLVLTPELAGIFSAKDDDLRRVLGHITRLADGDGLESDSGAQGHRKYGSTFFVWIGAAVKIPPRVWKLFGTLGHKIHFFSVNLPEISDEELEEIARTNRHAEKVQQVEHALYDYFVTFDAAPDIDHNLTDHAGILKVKWNEQAEQKDGIKHLSKLAQLLARLRGTVYISAYAEEFDYDNGISTIENPTRAVTILRNLALAHAISQGRDSISLDDIPMIIRVVLSTAVIGRSKVFELLIKHSGEITTSEIYAELGVSPPAAKRAMKELQALKLVSIAAVTGYSNSESKITLSEKFSWLKTSEFRELWKKSIYQVRSGAEVNNCESGECKEEQDSVWEATDLEERSDKRIESYDDNSCHTSKANPPPETLIKNIDDNADLNKGNGSEIDCNNRINYLDIQIPETKSEGTSLYSNSREDDVDSLWGSESFQRVTPSHGHKPTETSRKGVDDTISVEYKLLLSEILDLIRNANGAIVSLATALEFVCGKNQALRFYLGGKLTQRENREVKKLYLDIIHQENIEVVKYKPQLLVRWNLPDRKRDDVNQ